MKIFGVALSPYVRKVKMALNEKGIAYDMVPTDNEANLTELHKLNPRGEVPTLVDGDVVIPDSTNALQYIEERYPEPPLLPAKPALRVKARQIEDIGDRLGDAILYALAYVFMRGHADLHDRIVPQAKAELDDLYAFLAEQLGDREYLCGDFSWADLGMLPTVSGAQFFQMGPGENYPHLDAWLQRCVERPAVAQDMAEVMAAASGGLPNPRLAKGHPHVGENMRAERAEFFLRCGLAEFVGTGIAKGTIRVGLPLMHARALT